MLSNRLLSPWHRILPAPEDLPVLLQVPHMLQDWLKIVQKQQLHTSTSSTHLLLVLKALPLKEEQMVRTILRSSISQTQLVGRMALLEVASPHGKGRKWRLLIRLQGFCVKV